VKNDELVASLRHKKEVSLHMNEEKRQRKETIAALLHQTAEDHHIAYKETDGVDPDWSIWYAGHLLEKGFNTLLDAQLLKSDLIYLLVMADKQQMSEAPGGHWENYYAAFFVNRYLK
jgi:hypothetical protein